LNIAPLAEEERFATNAQRVKHRPALIPLLQEQIGAFAERAELLALFQENNIPAGAVRDLPDVFAQPLAQTLLVNTFDESGQPIQCVKSVVFELSD
jgi:crotonobetainyl-CoA:carnitine CoA-transferase CaiB-like acyl-CoA transferase